jgi:hypothetical protein
MCNIFTCIYSRPGNYSTTCNATDPNTIQPRQFGHGSNLFNQARPRHKSWFVAGWTNFTIFDCRLSLDSTLSRVSVVLESKQADDSNCKSPIATVMSIVNCQLSTRPRRVCLWRQASWGQAFWHRALFPASNIHTIHIQAGAAAAMTVSHLALCLVPYSHRTSRVVTLVALCKHHTHRTKKLTPSAGRAH